MKHEFVTPDKQNKITRQVILFLPPYSLDFCHKSIYYIKIQKK